ncbi:MAG: hypothetical protein U0Q10_05410 [Dermatophilaceae bacterium]
MYKVKAAYSNDGLASRYQATQTRLRKFEKPGRPGRVPVAAERSYAADRRANGQRAVVAERLEPADRRR